MLRQMREKTVRHTMHERAASDTQLAKLTLCVMTLS